MKKLTFAVIVANRGFFPDKLAKEGRKDILNILKKNGYKSVAVSVKDTKFGTVETLQDAKKCAQLFKQEADNIDGIIVTLPNFGDEKAVTETIKRSGLEVPVLIHAQADQKEKMLIEDRRDSFCGKISVCNNLRYAGIPYSLTKAHTLDVKSKDFENELDNFASICRIVKGLKNARFGAVGARPTAFNTVRYSEKLLQFSGISVETIDLAEILANVQLLSNTDRTVKRNLNKIKKYINTKSVPDDALLKIAQFGTVLNRWIKENQLDGTAIQCWTALEEFFGIVPCTLMSMMSESLLPSACEMDITGLLAMYILQLASGNPSAILDWNNNYADDPDKCVLFHCSNIPISFLRNEKMDYQEIIAGSVGKENTFGTVTGRIKPAKATFCRASTDDTAGLITCYVGEGEFTNDKLDTFGGYGIFKVNDLQDLMQYICKMGFEHHVAVNLSQKADAIAEALDTYMGWEVYRH